MGDIVIRVENLGKEYRLGKREGYRTIRESISKVAASSWKKLTNRNNEPPQNESTFWALCDVSFEVTQGEVVGVIGRNGAGKSTLLKILSQITEPTTGRVELTGRVGSLLEVGTGFHPELTGRENIYLNGAILGMRRTEIARKFDEIISFAGIETFLDTAVKHYSSGMYTRLAFAVAAHLEPEVLVVDEVLAVGDIEFQKKCLGKMGEVAKGGRTVLFVSHNMHAVNTLCKRGLVLNAGSVIFDGSAAASVAKYLDLCKSGGSGLKSGPRAGSGEWRFSEISPDRHLFHSNEPKQFTFQVDPIGAQAGAVYLSGLLLNEEGTVLAQFDSRLVGQWVHHSQIMRGTLRINDLWLKPGLYTLDLYICSPSGIIDRVESAAEFEVSQVLPYPQSAPGDATAAGVVFSDFSWHFEPIVSISADTY